MAQDVAEKHGSDLMTRPVESLSPAEALARAALSGTRQLVRLIEEPFELGVTFKLGLAHRRLVGDMSAIALKLAIQTAEGEFRARRDDAMARLLAALAAEDATKPAE
jgi:hypothetical protein